MRHLPLAQYRAIREKHALKHSLMWVTFFEAQSNSCNFLPDATQFPPSTLGSQTYLGLIIGTTNQYRYWNWEYLLTIAVGLIDYRVFLKSIFKERSHRTN